MKTSILSQKRFLKHILLLIVFLAYGVSSFAYIVAWRDEGIVSIKGVNYHLYYITKTKPMFGGTTTENLAYVEGITGSGEIVIPETVVDGPSTYEVKGLRYNPITEEVTPTLSSSVTTIRFEGAIELNPKAGSPTFNCPYLQYIYFEGHSPYLYGSYGDYFQSPKVNHITVYLSDKTEEEIERMTTHNTVWGDFDNVAPISNSTVKRNVSLSINHAKVEIDSDTYVRDASTQVDMYSDLTLKVYQGYDTYHVESVKLNGMEILGDMTFTQGSADYVSYYTYTLQNVMSDTYITVNGENINKEVTVICNQGGTYSSPNMNTSTVLPNVPTAIRWLKTDGNPTLKIIPNEGCTFDRLYYNSNDNTTRATDNGDGTYSYTLTDDAFISLVFKDNSIIQFADPAVKAICVENWDTNGDGELSKREAAAVTTLIDSETNQSVFRGKGASITSFDEFQYFTGLTQVEQYAFYGVSIETIVLPNTIKTIGENAFSNSGIRSIVIPEGIETIGNNAFKECMSLADIRLPNSLLNIGYFAFGQTVIKHIFIPQNVANITPGTGANIFTGCSQLATIAVDENNKTYDSRDNCSAIISKGNGTSSNPVTLVYGCKNTVIPEGVQCIGMQAFRNSGIKKMTIPGSVTKIKLCAFMENQLDTLVMKGNIPMQFDKNGFRNNSAEVPEISNCVLVVPHGTLEAYAQAGWKTTADGGYFKEVIEAEDTNFDLNSDSKIDIGDVTKLVNEVLKQHKP